MLGFVSPTDRKKINIGANPIMKSLFVSFSLGSILLVAATAISGCGIGTQIDASPAVVTMAGGLSGNNFGGHAPIV
jgi:hypothetical protein